MKFPRPVHALVAALLLAAPPLASAQTIRSVGLEPPRAAAGTEQTDSAQRLASLITGTFSSELAAAGVDLRPASAADVLLLVQYQIAGARLLMVVTLTDRVSGLVLGGGAYTGTADLALVTTIRAAAEELAVQLRDVERVVNERPRSPDIVRTVTVTSVDEGAGVLVGGELAAGRVSNGGLVLPFLPMEIGTSLLLETRLDGYYPRRQTVIITDETMVVALEPLEPIIRWEIAGAWSPMRWAGAAMGFRRYLVPRRLYAQSTNQLSTRYRFAAGSRASTVIDTRLSMGGYVFAPAERRLRIGIATGVGLTLSTLAGEQTVYTFVDPYFNIVSLELRLQLNRFAPFIQGEMIHYGAADSGYLNPGTMPYVSLGVLVPWRP